MKIFCNDTDYDDVWDDGQKSTSKYTLRPV